MTAINTVTLRTGEGLDTDIVSGQDPGAVFQVVEVGSGRRIKVQSGSIQGWISTKTKTGEPLIMKSLEQPPSAPMSLEDIKVGGRHEVLTAVTVRESDDLQSGTVASLPIGSVVTIAELSATNPRRARVEEGWISLATKEGAMLVGEDLNDPMPAGSGGSAPNIVTIRETLEAARAGDLEAIVRVAIPKGQAKVVPKPFNYLNSSDVKGKTPLIYASAFGNLEVVDFLVRREDVDVNAVDDLQKNALHHACRRSARGCQGAPPQEIVPKLLAVGMFIDARDHNGCTALMFAAGSGLREVSQLLLDAKANANRKDFEGNTPLDYAHNFHEDSCAALLREYGAEAMEFDLDEFLRECEEEVAADAAADAARKTVRKRANTAHSHAGTKASVTPRKTTVSKTDQSPARKTVPPKKSADHSTAKAPKAAKSKPNGKAAPAKKKRPSRAFQEMGDAEKWKAMSIAVLPAGDDATEAGRHTRKLEIALANDLGSHILQDVISAAEEAGADATVLGIAAAALEKKLHAEEVQKRIFEAAHDNDMAALGEAIAAAVRAGLPQSDIDEAKAILAEEMPKAEARAKLKQAQTDGDMELLRSAIAAAKAAGLPREEVSAFEELLESAVSKGNVETGLSNAVASKDVPALKLLIKQAQELGIDEGAIAQAQAVLIDEEPKALAREQLREAMAKVDVAAIQAAVDAGRAASLAGSELAAAEERIRELSAKARAIEDLAAVIASVADVDMKSIEALREAKKVLNEGINTARACGVPEKALKDAELRRRKLHNTIENLKGAIRVFCRVRPMNKNEVNDNAEEVTQKLDAMTLKVGKERFGFDSVFYPGTQDEVFEDCRDLVQSAADGYNVTMFAYGQTGAGKTYTMYGTKGDRGTAPRTIHELFRVIEENSDRYTYTIMGSMLELYQQTLVDLIAKARGHHGDNTHLDVRYHKGGAVMVENMLEQEVSSARELEHLLDEGNKQRTVKATAMNADSSRSHLVLIIQVISVNKETGARLRGKILIVDLAGSERLKKSGVEKEMAKEAIEINKSLTALGDVIQSLTQNDQVIPYRNHKLTQLMQDSLGGNAKTLMFVNTSPASTNLDETLMSLKWATRAKKVHNAAPNATKK